MKHNRTERKQKVRNHLKEYRYRKGDSPQIDQEFLQATPYGGVKEGETYLFWKKGLRWYMVEMDRVRRIYRRVEEVNTKMCCGNVNFDIQKLIFLLEDESSLELLIGEGMPKEAEILYRNLQERYPRIRFGKPRE